MNTLENKKTAYKVSGVSIGVNTALSLGKLGAGILSNSAAMVTDAIHSASDVLSTFVVIIGIKLSSKKADEDHSYGHERLESIAAIILGMFLFVTGLLIGYKALGSLFRDQTDLVIPGTLALVAALISIVVKEGMYWYTRAAAKKIGSDALMADAWHHRSDALSSVGAFLGIGAARLGFPIFDPIASIIICLFISKAAYDIFKDATDKLVDHACDETTQEKMKREVLSVPGVIRIDSFKTRLFGPKVYVDIEISADQNLSFRQAHAICETVEDKLKSDFPLVKAVMVHVSPISLVLAEPA